MSPSLIRVAAAIGFCCCSPAWAIPILSVVGDQGFRGEKVSVALFDAATDAFVAAAILVDFQASNLEFLPPPVPPGFIDPATVAFDDSEAGSGRILIFLGQQGDPPVSGESGALLRIDFNIRASAALGATPVSFRCVPGFDPSGSAPIDAVDADTTPEELAALCMNDYPIPFLSGNVDVLARTDGQAPLPGTAWLVLAGLGLIALRRRARIRLGAGGNGAYGASAAAARLMRASRGGPRAPLHRPA